MYMYICMLSSLRSIYPIINWVLGILALAIVGHVLGKYMIIGYLDFCG